MTSNPEHTISLADTCGASWWKALDVAVEAINCPSCKEEAKSLLSGMHDLVNLRMGKPLYDAGNFAKVLGLYKLAEMGLEQVNDRWGSRCRDEKGHWIPTGECGESLETATIRIVEDRRITKGILETLKLEGLWAS